MNQDGCSLVALVVDVSAADVADIVLLAYRCLDVAHHYFLGAKFRQMRLSVHHLDLD